MSVELTTASFFSGIGGMGLGLERAGWTTVSFSEIDPYASSILARHWPDVPNLGDIVSLVEHDSGVRDHPWKSATLWTGGFPCQDLSVAGKRAGFTGHRSSLAFTFIDLMERYLPRAVILENVPGLLSSHSGRDMARLVGEMVDIGYGVGWTTLDARWFGVPQRRRRVFLLAVRSGPDDPDGHLAAQCAASVLAVGQSCERHPAKGGKAREKAPSDAGGSTDETVGALPAGVHGFPDGVQEFLQGHFRVVPSGQETDPSGVRGASRISGRLDDRDRLEVEAYVKVSRQTGPDGIGERWALEDTSPTLNIFDATDVRATTLAVAATLNSGGNNGGFRTEPGEHLTIGGGEVSDDELLPLGLDSHRYRVLGNAICVPVAEWLGHRLASHLREVDVESDEIDHDAKDELAERQFLRPINPDPVTAFARATKTAR